MKISEMINLLKAEQEKRGDLDVILYSRYGSSSDVFEVAKDSDIEPKDLVGRLWIWTDIYDG